MSGRPHSTSFLASFLLSIFAATCPARGQSADGDSRFAAGAGGGPSFVHLYVVDTAAADVRTFDAAGAPGARLTAARGQLFNPKDIEIDVAGGLMYYTSPAASINPVEGSRIGRAKLDGSGIQDLVINEVDGIVEPFGIALDIPRGRMYWTDRTTMKIQRANLDGSNLEDVVDTAPDEPVGVAVDVVGGMIYWSQQGPVSRIMRAPAMVDPPQEIVVDNLSVPVDVEIDGEGYVYWTDTAFDSVQRALITDPIPEEIVSGLDDPEGLSIDRAALKVYWLNSNAQKIQRSNLDGSAVEDLVDNSGNPPESDPLTAAARGLFVEPVAQQLYWVDANRDKIYRAGRDIPAGQEATTRGDIETVRARSSGLLFPRRVAIDLPGGKMYWTDTGTMIEGFGPPRILRSNLDGSQQEDLVSLDDLPDLTNPNGIALDLAADPQKVYWSEDVAGAGRIRRADLDGANIQLVLDNLARPRELLIDPDAGFLYWAEYEGPAIKRAALSDFSTETLYDGTAGLINPNGLDLDVDSVPSMLYWSDVGSATIHRALADGTSVAPLETVVQTGGAITLLDPQGVALDVANNSLYWVDRGTDEIGRADLDGSNAGILSPSPGPGSNYSPQGIALDFALLDDRDEDGVDVDGDGSGTPIDAPCASTITLDCDDNCPTAANALQADVDGDGHGDLCDPCPSRGDDLCIRDGSTVRELAAGVTALTPDAHVTVSWSPGTLPLSDHTVSITEETDFDDPTIPLGVGAVTTPGIALAQYDLRSAPALVPNGALEITMVRSVAALDPSQITALAVHTLDGAVYRALPDSACVLDIDIATCTAVLEDFARVALATPVDLTGLCPGGTVAECADLDDDGIRDDPCRWDECAAGACSNVNTPFADVGGPFGDCEADAVPDANDYFHALNCFSNQDTAGPGTTYPCEDAPPLAFNVDAGGPFGRCCPDGVCDGNDAFHALNAFSNENPCACDADGGRNFACPCETPTDPPGNPVLCPVGPMPQTPFAAGVRSVATTGVELRTARRVLWPGELVRVQAFLTDSLPDLRGYQLHLGVAGGRRGDLQLIDTAIEQRDDGVFAGLSDWSAFNVTTVQMLAGLDSEGVHADGGGYLATLTFQATKDAEGTFVVDLLHDDSDPNQRTFLFPTPPGHKIEIVGTTPAVVTVVPEGADRRGAE